jgi:hypothetical protein
MALYKLPGPNELRFESFNNMPKIFSKYQRKDYAYVPFSKLVSREADVIGGETGIDGKKEKFL